MQLIRKNSSHSLMTVILVWAACAAMSSMYVTIPLISIFARDFAVPESHTAWISSIYSVFYAVGALFYGPISDKYGRKQIIVAGMLLLMVSSLLLGFSKALTHIIILRGVHGAAAASYSPVALAYVTESFPQHKKVAAVGFVSTGFLMAGIVGQVFSSFIYTQLGWNYTFIILAVVYAVTALLIVTLVPGYPPRAAGIGNPVGQTAALFKQGRITYVYIVAAIALLTFVGMYTALGSCLENKFGLDGRQILYVRLAGIVGMLLSPLTGGLSKKLGLAAVLRYSLILSIIGLVILAFSANVAVMVIASIIFVCGVAITVPSMISLVGELGGALRGVAISIYTFILFLGASAGPMLAVNILKTGSYTTTFLALALCSLIGAISTLFIRLPAAPVSAASTARDDSKAT